MIELEGPLMFCCFCSSTIKYINKHLHFGTINKKRSLRPNSTLIKFVFRPWDLEKRLKKSKLLFSHFQQLTDDTHPSSPNRRDTRSPLMAHIKSIQEESACGSVSSKSRRGIWVYHHELIYLLNINIIHKLNIIIEREWLIVVMPHSHQPSHNLSISLSSATMKLDLRTSTKLN